MSIVAFNFLSDICTYVPLNIKIDKNKEQCSVPSLVEVVLEKNPEFYIYLKDRIQGECMKGLRTMATSK